MMRMLVSVRSVAEARIAALEGADFIDLKEPRDGALGGLPVATIAAVVRALRDQGSRLPISATIGDLPMSGLAAILAQVEAVAACGVDYVKVGIERAPQPGAVLDALAATGHAIVPVFIGDRGVAFEQVEHAVGGAGEGGGDGGWLPRRLPLPLCQQRLDKNFPGEGGAHRVAGDTDDGYVVSITDHVS